MTLRTCMAGSLVAVCLLLGAPREAGAQAWSGNEGDLSLSFASAFQFSNAVWWGGDIGKISGVSAESLRSTVGAEITPIERLSFYADLTGQLDHYSGAQTASRPDIVVAHGENDDGDWHGSVSDANLEARYQILEGPLALSPVLRAKIPVTSYEEKGYAAPGTGLFEVSAGAYAGKFGVFHPNVFLHGGYSFTFVESEDGGGEATEDFSTHYSSFLLEGGTLLFGGRALASVGTDVRWAHGGFELTDYGDAPDVLKTWHDPILARKYVALKAAGNFFATESLTAGAAFGIVVWGDNASDAKVFNLNVTWTTAVL